MKRFELIMQRKECDRTVDRLTTFRAKADHFEAGEMNFLSELIDGDVRRRADENLLFCKLDHLINECSACHRFAGARRPLNLHFIEAHSLVATAFVP